MYSLRHLDLFSGIGGFSLAAQWLGGIETIQFVEIDPFCQRVLAKNFPGVPIHGDISTFTHRGGIDLITAGFPCQDISIAGHGVGLDGERSGLFREVVRIVRECRPRYVILENVAALLTSNGGRDMATVLWELSESGYDAEWEIIPASALGANHARGRDWIVAYPNSVGREICERKKRGQVSRRRLLSQDSGGQKLCKSDKRHELLKAPRLGDVPQFPRANDGFSSRMDRVRALGNSILPQVAMIPLQRVLNLNQQLQKCIK